MSARESDPRRLDVEIFAKEGGELEGRWPLRQFDRVTEVSPAEADVDRDLQWSVRGEARRLRGGDSQTWLHLRATTEVPLECQRCLKPVLAAVSIERSFLFVHGEDAAEQLDNEIEDDVLPISRAFDLRELIEDEVLLALPLVPRHEVCPVPLVVAPSEELTDDKPNPFAVLSVLKAPGSLN